MASTTPATFTVRICAYRIGATPENSTVRVPLRPKDYTRPIGFRITVGSAADNNYIIHNQGSDTTIPPHLAVIEHDPEVRERRCLVLSARYSYARGLLGVLDLERCWRVR